MNEDNALTLSDERRAQTDSQLEQAFIAFKPGLSPVIRLDENEFMQRMRDQQALIDAKMVGIKKATQDDASADSYVRILGENFNLIVDDISAEELDLKVRELWRREEESIKRETLAVFERGDARGLMEDTIKANLPHGMGSEQIEMMVRVASQIAIESVEVTGYSALKDRIDYMRKIYAVHQAQKNKASRSSVHHTVQ